MTKKTLVLIPHLPSAQQGHELILAIEGWRQHFKTPHIIALMGENLPTIAGVVNVESPRVAPVEGEYRSHLDYVSCTRKALEMFPDATGFVVAADDVFAVNDFTLTDVKIPKIEEYGLPTKGADKHPNPWRRNLAKTGLVCQGEGWTMHNWTTHLPHYYEKRKLLKIYERFDCDHSSYVVENLYYNAFPPKGEPEVMHFINRWKFEVSFRPLDRAGLYEALASRVWVTCNEHGWSPEMEYELARHYNIKL